MNVGIHLIQMDIETQYIVLTIFVSDVLIHVTGPVLDILLSGDMRVICPFIQINDVRASKSKFMHTFT